MHTPMNAWAETTPHSCPEECSKPHAHVDDLCAVPRCGELLKAGESCYALTQLERGAASREPWACWRHIG